MLLMQRQGLNYFQFPGLAQVPGLFHGITTCLSGNNQTRHPFNIGLDCGDPSESVWDNRHRMLSAFASGLGIFARQVHGVQVAVWPDHQDLQKSIPSGAPFVYLKGDALVTSVSGHALVIQTADCQSVLLVDPIKRVAANVHSGWRGSVSNLLSGTIAVMKSHWGCRPGDILGAIGPSLGPCCAEFIHYRREIPERYWPYRQHGDLFDFWQMSVDQLTAAGVPSKQIAASGICTRCNRHLFFSYRGEGGGQGRFASVIVSNSAHS